MNKNFKPRVNYLSNNTRKDKLLFENISNKHYDDGQLFKPYRQWKNNIEKSKSMCESSFADGVDTIINTNSDSDYSYHESDDDLPLSMRSKYYFGKDGTKWNRRPNSRIVKYRNKFADKTGVRPIGKNAKTVLDCWALFFSNTMVEHIVKCTNIYIENVRSNYNRVRDASDTCVREIRALFGILYTIGELKYLFICKTY